jgi:hypothetical protein
MAESARRGPGAAHGRARSGAAARPPRWPARLTGPFVASLLGVAFALLCGRLFWLIDRYSVNVLFWDQWDLFDPFFEHASAWELFRYRFGPHRQGIAFLLTRALMDATDWNTRAEAFMIGALVALAAALALLLRRRLFGPLTPMDVAIPLLVLTPAQYGIFVHIPNASHGAAPLLLLIALCCGCTLAGRAPRCAALLVLNFLLIHTGFGIFAGAITPVLLVSDCVEAARGEGARAAVWPAFCVALSLASLGFFFVGYAFDPVVDDFAFPSPHASLYPKFVALMLANVLGVKGTDLLPTLVGFGALAAVLLTAVVHGLGLFVRRGEARRRSAAIAALAVFGLLFCAGTAVGRITLGLNAAQSTRYVPLVVPAFLGLYLHLQTLRSLRGRLLLSCLAVVALAAATFPMRADEARFIAILARDKQRWVDAYLETGSVRVADARARRPIYPNPPDVTHLEEKLDTLRRQRLNLFANRPPPEAPRPHEPRTESREGSD